MKKPISEHGYHKLSDSALLYVLKDAGEAARAVQGHDYAAECKYLDQVNDAITVINYRKTLGHVQTVCQETAYGKTERLSYQIKVF